MQEFSVYSVIPPEGCAAILWRDANRKVEAAAALKITAPDMLALGLIDAIIPEPAGGAHNDYEAATALVDQALSAALADVSRADVDRPPRTRATRSSAAWAPKGRRSSTRGTPGALQTEDWRLTSAIRNAQLLWQHLPCNEDDARALGAALNLHPAVARLLCLRGLGDPESRTPVPESVAGPPPRSLQARGHGEGGRAGSSGRIARRERIAIHGDYDVDGITSTVILRRALEMLGGDVVHFIPERLRDGYGLQPAAIDRLHAEGVRLDHLGGLRHPAGPKPRSARASSGVDLIITDHHEPDGDAAAGARGDQPEAARLHLSGQESRRRRRRAEAGAGALRARRQGKWLPAFVKIAAIGTLADVVPLVGENRVIAKLGLASLSTGRHTVGLRALLEASG